MEILIIPILIHLFFAIIAFVINYKKATEPYFIKDAFQDAGLCLIPAINIAYVVICFYETFLEKYINKIHFSSKKYNSFLQRRLK
jgi:uncharacterized membrane protein YwzB